MSEVQYPEDRDSKLMKTFGVQYFEPEVKTIVKNKEMNYIHMMHISVSIKLM